LFTYRHLAEIKHVHSFVRRIQNSDAM